MSRNYPLSQLDEGKRWNARKWSCVSFQKRCSLPEFAAAEKNVKLELSGESVTVTGVRKLLREAVFNLCDNAVKYNVSGAW